MGPDDTSSYYSRGGRWAARDIPSIVCEPMPIYYNLNKFIIFLTHIFIYLWHSYLHYWLYVFLYIYLSLCLFNLCRFLNLFTLCFGSLTFLSLFCLLSLLYFLLLFVCLFLFVFRLLFSLLYFSLLYFLLLFCLGFGTYYSIISFLPSKPAYLSFYN